MRKTAADTHFCRVAAVNNGDNEPSSHENENCVNGYRNVEIIISECLTWVRHVGLMYFKYIFNKLRDCFV